MNVFPKDKTITHFSSSMKASYNGDLGSTIQVESHDCYGGQVDSEKVLRPHIDLSIMNQATGPFFVNGLEKSDVLKLDIIDIELVATGIMVTFVGLGMLGDEVTSNVTKMFPVKHDKVPFNDDLNMPIKPMIGDIGTAPGSRDSSCAIQGPHGGNLDTKDIAPG